MMLNIFNTGGLTLGITLFWWAIATRLGYQAVKAHNSGWEKLDSNGVYTEGKEKIPYKKIAQFWGALICIGMWIICLIAIAADYKGA